MANTQGQTQAEELLGREATWENPELLRRVQAREVRRAALVEGRSARVRSLERVEYWQHHSYLNRPTLAAAEGPPPLAPLDSCLAVTLGRPHTLLLSAGAGAGSCCSLTKTVMEARFEQT